MTSSNGLAQYDLNGNGAVNQADVDYLVHTILHTNYGDANLDGRVDYPDIQTVLNNWLATDAGWAKGDFNGDGVVNNADLQLVLDNWMSTSFSSSVMLGSGMESAPKPTSLALLAAGAVLALRRRRKAPSIK